MSVRGESIVWCGTTSAPVCIRTHACSCAVDVNVWCFSNLRRYQHALGQSCLKAILDVVKFSTFLGFPNSKVHIITVEQTMRTATFLATFCILLFWGASASQLLLADDGSPMAPPSEDISCSQTGWYRLMWAYESNNVVTDSSCREPTPWSFWWNGTLCAKWFKWQCSCVLWSQTPCVSSSDRAPT